VRRARSALAPRLAPCLALLALARCAEPANLVAVEDLGDTDLRVVVARTSKASEVVVLVRDQPYVFRGEPLGDALARGDALEVHVLAYRLGALVTAFPALARLSASEVAASLAPRLGEPGPGAYAAPEPSVVLETQVDGDTGTPVYREVEWASIRARPELSVVFDLDGARVCPPVARPFRVFSRDDPATVCLHQRTDGCEWGRPVEAPCANAGAIFGAPAPTRIRQLPDGALALEPGARRCTPVPPRDSGQRRGETSAWSCDGRVVAAQDGFDTPSGSPWVPAVIGAMGAAEQVEVDFVVPTPSGAIRALDLEDGPVLRAIGVSEGMASYGDLRHPVVDVYSRASAEAVRTADGLTVEMEAPGQFATDVGMTPGQCFRRLERPGGRPAMNATIAARRSSSQLALEAPGVGGPLERIVGWDVVGDPGSALLLGPRFTEASLVGTPRTWRFTARTTSPPWLLVVHGEGRTQRLVQVTRFPNDDASFGCALDVPHPPGLAGHIVAGRSGMLAHVEGGLLPLDSAGRPQALVPVPGLTASAVLFASATDGGAARAVFWLRDEGAVLVVDPLARTHHRVELTRETVATVSGPSQAPTDGLVVLNGPRVLHRTAANTLELLDVSSATGGERISFAVPAFAEVVSGRRVWVDEGAVLELEGQRLVGWFVEQFVGVLDLRSGRSTAVDVGGRAEVESLFRDPGTGQLVLVVKGGRAGERSLSLVGVPSLEAR
jgi:hypothetical protein